MASQDSKRMEERRTRQEMVEDAGMMRVTSKLPGLAWFNAEHGFLEALLRGFKSGLLKESEYRQLCNCENLEDVKLTLGDTDYASVLQNISKLTPEVILDRCKQKTLDEFEFIRGSATGALATFLDFITYEFLIKNICFVITGLIKGSDPETLLSKIHPLGRSPHIKSILTFENQTSSDGLLDLYRTVLVETPVARYFEIYFNSEVKTDGGGGGSREIQRVYNEVEIDIVTNMLQKLWLEDFYTYCCSLGGETAIAMKVLLEFEADRRAISITINSFDTPLNEPANRDTDRKALYCNFGTLYPEATLFEFSKVADASQLQVALNKYPVFASIWRQSQDSGRSLNDLLSEYQVRLMLLAFMGQSHFACFYAYLKLKQQEEGNLKWILSCIKQRRPAKDKQRWIKIL
eukprot:gb/GEZN01004771.1/.p1 GENE.gb/GEZN01004771.1/~~gb/GEZN01004771.1/.p1  ORF type:complete len:405 (-),score=70.25 gb/GEZN01004771.1/:577-1791(-)